MVIERKNEDGLARMRAAGRIVAKVLEEMRLLVGPGITAQALDAAAESLIRDLGAVPSFKGYMGYPATICASVNEQVVHGIPGARELREGDIVSIDVGVIWEGFQGDAAVTLAVGEIAPEAVRLMQATRAALDAGIAVARKGNRLGDVSHAIERAAHERGYRPVREYGGHGIGREMHEPPRIPNRGQAGRGFPLEVGMALALEPMLTKGDDRTQVLSDRWTVVTLDGSLSAHFEHTIAVTENGAEILTRVQDPSAVEVKR